MNGRTDKVKGKRKDSILESFQGTSRNANAPEKWSLEKLSLSSRVSNDSGHLFTATAARVDCQYA